MLHLPFCLSRDRVMTVWCVVAGHDANGDPGFFFCKVVASQEDYILGEHYDIAELHAQDEGYEPRLTFDEHDGPAWLFERFVWESAHTVRRIGTADYCVLAVARGNERRIE